jgi:hypothetical protein
MAPSLGGRPGSAEAVSAALEANRALVAELQSLEQSLVQEEAKLLAKTQSIRRGMALRRAQRAMDALLPRSSPQQPHRPFQRKIRPRKRVTGVKPRSYIRPEASFFTDETEVERKVGRPRKKPKKKREALDDETEEQRVLRELTEPPPNQETLALRAHSHESFLAEPPNIFTPKERKVLKDFTEDYFFSNGVVDIPVEVWNGIQAWQGTRKSKQFPIERSGFACKLWWDLHESPKLRLAAWTKQEDAALRRLATGEEDPMLVNQWQEIAKRMPLPGRPAVHCLIRYQTALCSGNTRSNFTPEEDQILLQAVPVLGEKWNIIADLLDARVPEQIRHRWQLSLSPGLRRGKFSIIEDRRLLLALRSYVPAGGEFNVSQVAWNEVSHHVPGRSMPAIRDRYTNSINPELSFRKFTKQEDAAILARVQEWGVDSPRLWTRLANELGDRSDSQVARRWRTLDPEAWEKRRQVLEEASKAQTTSVFRRRSTHRHDPRFKTRNTLRSSYNGEAESSSTDALPLNARGHTSGSREPHPSELLQSREVQGDNGSTQVIF